MMLGRKGYISRLNRLLSILCKLSHNKRHWVRWNISSFLCPSKWNLCAYHRCVRKAWNSRWKCEVLDVEDI